MSSQVAAAPTVTWWPRASFAGSPTFASSGASRSITTSALSAWPSSDWPPARKVIRWALGSSDALRRRSASSATFAGRYTVATASWMLS